MIGEASTPLDPLLCMAWLEWGAGILPRTQVMATNTRAEKERKESFAAQLAVDAKRARTVKRQTSRSSRLQGGDEAQSPEQVGTGVKRGRSRWDTLKPVDMKVADVKAAGASAVGKGKGKVCGRRVRADAGELRVSQIACSSSSRTDMSPGGCAAATVPCYMQAKRTTCSYCRGQKKKCSHSAKLKREAEMSQAAGESVVAPLPLVPPAVPTTGPSHPPAPLGVQVAPCPLVLPLSHAYC
jgi:hypothetical protein